MTWDFNVNERWHETKHWIGFRIFGCGLDFSVKKKGGIRFDAIA